MLKFHQGLRPHLLKKYIVSVNEAVDDSLVSLGSKGEFEVFAHMKSIVHKIGFLCWV